MMDRRRALMATAKDTGPIYIITNGVVQPIVTSWENKGYKRGSVALTQSYDSTNAALSFNLNTTSPKATGTLTVSPIIFPKGRTKLCFKAKATYTPASNNVMYYITAAENVANATTYADAFTNYKRYSFASTSIVQTEIDISQFNATGFFISFTIDRIVDSSLQKKILVYDMWIE